MYPSVMADAEDRPATGRAQRNGNLRIPLPLDEALKAALEVKPPEKPPRKPRQKKRTKS